MENYTSLEEFISLIMKKIDVQWQIASIGLLACARHLPNYEYFQHKTGYGNSSYFKEYIWDSWKENKCKNLVGVKPSKFDATIILYSPDLDSTYKESGAIDADIAQSFAVLISLMNLYAFDLRKKHIIDLLVKAVMSTASFICLRSNGRDVENFLYDQLVTEEVSINMNNIDTIISCKSPSDIPDTLWEKNYSCGNFLQRSKRLVPPKNNHSQMNLFD